MSSIPSQHHPESLHTQLLSHWKTWFLAIFLLYVALTLKVAFISSLKNIPGPFIARFTRLFMLFRAAEGHADKLYPELHHKYGSIVRVGPNKVDISDPDMIPVIYNIGGNAKFYKSSYYDVFKGMWKGDWVENLFATRDPAYHKHMKHNVSQWYSLSNLRQLEGLVDETSMEFMDAMKDLQGQAIDLGEWVQWYAFDVIGRITFLKPFDFIKDREDKGSVIERLETQTKYNTTVAQIPELHKVLLGNRWNIKLLSKTPIKASPMAKIGKEIVDARKSYDEREDKVRGDFHSYLHNMQAKEPDRLSNSMITSNLAANMAAGSDTTAMAFRAIFYYLVKNPRSYQTLMSEIHAADRAGELSDFVSFKEGSALKYFQAVIKEAMRVHPGVGPSLERLVPPEGAELCGQLIPGGTTVGISAWTVNFDKGVFGSDADVFHPERWLEASEEQLKRMERTWFSFGYGTRACIGKNIAILEMTKLVPTLLRRYNLEWAAEEDEWKISGYFFCKQSGVIMRLTPRDVGEPVKG